MAGSLLQALLSLAASVLKLVPLFAAWWAGKKSARADQAQEALADAVESHRIDDAVARLDDAALRRELHKSSE
jgi:hypothetical protein